MWDREDIAGPSGALGFDGSELVPDEEQDSKSSSSSSNEPLESQLHPQSNETDIRRDFDYGGGADMEDMLDQYQADSDRSISPGSSRCGSSEEEEENKENSEEDDTGEDSQDDSDPTEEDYMNQDNHEDFEDVTSYDDMLDHYLADSDRSISPDLV